MMHEIRSNIEINHILLSVALFTNMLNIKKNLLAVPPPAALLFGKKQQP